MSVSFNEKYAPILENIQRGSSAMDGIIELLRLRVNAETQFTLALQNIMKQSANLISNCFDSKTTLQTYGFDALYCDIKHEYTQRMEFLHSLKKDVLNPCLQTKQSYETKHKILINDTKKKDKMLTKHENEYMKLKDKYDRVIAKNKGKKRVSKQEPIMKRRYSQGQMVWYQQKHTFSDQISLSLVNIQRIELQRMNTLKDALTKWSAFITNFVANRNYDIRELTQSMALINVGRDICVFNKPRKRQAKIREKSYASSMYAEFRKQSHSTAQQSTPSVVK